MASMIEINSLTHPSVKFAVKLRESRAFREEHQACFISGRHLVESAAEKGLLQTLFSTNPLSFFRGSEGSYYVTEEILHKLTGLPSSDGIAAIARIPEEQNVSCFSWVLVLDRLSDPGNVGTLIRTAWSLGWEAVLVVEPACDPFNDKALRASKGALFSMPVICVDDEERMNLIQKIQPHLYLADLGGVPPAKVNFNDLPNWLILGNESRGPTSDWQGAARLTIPMQKGADSLNVAAAGAILMHTLKGQLS